MKNNKKSVLTMPRLEMRGVHKCFGATVALEQVDFAVFPGEVHALVGENGAGKSTLMKILSGAYKPDKGDMTFEGEKFQPKNPLDARKKGIGMIYQELSLAPHLTVMENIMLGMEPKRFGMLNWAEIKQKTLNAISHFEHPEIQPETKVADLTVAAKQLVEIGRALAIGCRLLVFDEPTSSLSQKDIDTLFKIINNLKKQNISIIYISHFLEEVRMIADRLTVLRDGAAVATKMVGAISSDEIIQMMVGRKVNELYPRSKRTFGEVVLEMNHLAGHKKPETASLQLYRGEVFGIGGLVGAGRTEFFRAIFGLDPVKSGEIKIGVYTGPASPFARWKQGVGYLSENRKEEGLVLNLSVAENVTLSKLNIFGPLGLILAKNRKKAAQKWINELDIRCLGPEQEVMDLSGGNQQKVALARLLQHDVDILLLDEPTKGIDVGAKAKIYQVINQLATGSSENNQKPKAILMISSYLPELLGVCDRVAIMHRGRLSLAKSTDEVDEHKLMLAATGQGELV